MINRPDVVIYVLPDGRRVPIMWDICRGVNFLDYMLADGRIVTAVIAPSQK